MATKRMCDVQDGDVAWVKAFEDDIDHLCGLIHEAFIENKVFLLSPVLRRLTSDHATKVKEKLFKVRGFLCVDNLGEPLTGRPANTEEGVS